MRWSAIPTELIVRLLIPTALMGAGLWYLGSLWDAQMREQNLILIQPAVLAMVPCYLGVFAFELRKYRQAAAAGAATSGVPALNASAWRRLAFMALAAGSVASFYLAGAIPTTVALVLLGLLVLGVRRTPLLMVMPLATAVVLWLVFDVGFGVRIPLLW